MKTLALCFCVLASALSLFAQAPLSGYDIFEVITDARMPSTAFTFKRTLTGEPIRGMRALTPVLTVRDAVKFDLASRELGGAPCDGISVLFQPGAKDKLLGLSARGPSAEVMIVINGTPCATFKLNELIQLIEKRARFFVIYPCQTLYEHMNIDAMVKQIKSDQWKAPINLDVPQSLQDKKSR